MKNYHIFIINCNIWLATSQWNAPEMVVYAHAAGGIFFGLFAILLLIAEQKDKELDSTSVTSDEQSK